MAMRPFQLIVGDDGISLILEDDNDFNRIGYARDGGEDSVLTLNELCAKNGLFDQGFR